MCWDDWQVRQIDPLLSLEMAKKHKNAYVLLTKLSSLQAYLFLDITQTCSTAVFVLSCQSRETTKSCLWNGGGSCGDKQTLVFFCSKMINI